MRELVTSVLAGVISAAIWEAVRWVAASVRARKNPPKHDEPKAG